MYRYKDQKLTLPQLWPLQTNGGAILGEWSTIYPPYMEDNGYGKTDGNTKGYYYIEASPFVTEGNRDIAYTYIQYPDGNEDEISTAIQDSILAPYGSDLDQRRTSLFHAS